MPVRRTELSPDDFLSKWSILLCIHWNSPANACGLVCICKHTRRPPISILYYSVDIISMGFELIHQKWYLRIGFWILEKIQPPTRAYWVWVWILVKRKSRMSITICSSQIKPNYECAAAITLVLTESDYFIWRRRFEYFLTISQVNITFMNTPAFYSQLKIHFYFCEHRRRRTGRAYDSKQNQFFLSKTLLQLKPSYRTETPNMTDSAALMRLFYWSQQRDAHNHMPMWTRAMYERRDGKRLLWGRSMHVTASAVCLCVGVSVCEWVMVALLMYSNRQRSHREWRRRRRRVSAQTTTHTIYYWTFIIVMD